MNETTDRELLEKLRRDAPLPLIAARIRRSHRGLSHDRLVELMGEPRVYRQTIIGYENVKHRPSLQMLERIAEATGREVRWFIDPALDESPFQAGSEAA